MTQLNITDGLKVLETKETMQHSRN